MTSVAVPLTTDGVNSIIQGHYAGQAALAICEAILAVLNHLSALHVP